MTEFLSPTPQIYEDGSEWYEATTLTGFKRARCSYTACCNTKFQSPAAIGAKQMLWEVFLRGYRVVNFIHDEIIVELPHDKWMHERIEHICDIMVSSMKKFCRNVRVTAEPAVMLNWSKAAEPVLDENGRYAIWKPGDE
jgi:hypothetical protein